MDCITGGYYLLIILISVLDKFCHLQSLMVIGIRYVFSEHFFLIPFTCLYCGTHTYHVYATIHLC